MSLINDALKQARKAPPRNTPSALPPLPPVANESAVFSWLLPAIVIVLIVAAIFFIGWAVAHHTVRSIVAEPETGAGTPPATTIMLPPATPRPAEPPTPASAPDLPKLQGIFYSKTAPSAIIDGKTVRPGDQFGQYRVKAISKYTVTLTGPDKKDIQLGMGN
jgi:hypothetical protein